jgi:hypothetical protein
MIIPFLKSLLNPKLPFDHPYSQYSKLLDEIRNSSVGAQVFDLMKADKHQKELPRFFRENMQKIYFACFVQNLLIKHETEALLQELDKLGIPAIPMKGTFLAERYFGHFAARGTSDIDLLIQPEHMEAATQCIQSKGYRTLLKVNPAHYHFEWVKDAPELPEPLLVELHWSLAPAGSSRMTMEHAWITSEPLDGYSHIRMMDTTYTFYALCLHGISHQMDSIRHALDLCLFIRLHAGTIGIQQMLERAEADGTKQRVMTALSITYQLFPELSNELQLPFPMKYRYWNEAFILDQSHGGSSYSPFIRTMFTVASMDTWRFRFIHLFRIVFPTREIARYSVDDDDVPNTLLAVYYRLYKQRFRKMLGGV